MHFPKDTSPNVIDRYTAAQGMSRSEIMASLLKLGPWWDMLCSECGVQKTDPVINTVHQAPALSLNAAVAQYDVTLDRAVVDHAIFAYKKKAGFRMDQKYKDLLVGLFDKLDVLKPRPLPEVPARVSAVIPGAIIEAINRMARFAVLNAPVFDNVPPPKMKTQVMLRCWAAGESKDAERQKAIGLAFQYAKIMGTCGVDKLNTTLAQVEAARGAVCTSFASAAAALLARGRLTTGYRVELISGPNHCFCLVNRQDQKKDQEGGAMGAKLMPGAMYWGDEVIIVDAWAGALGNNCFYASPAEFPKPLQIYFSQKLLQHYDSAKEAS